MTQAPREIEVTAADLPLHCPTGETALWCSHPRVFLDVAATGSVLCPYCGTRYRLKAGEKIEHHG
ncbi:zinc-finger domain protein [mine drainage metagenome]|uniref:Zinc-finger domain protein n=1 Tax=mine drainage metagenome TaxID=410659 RepID=A0A1J5REA8_9ZZZZ